MNCTDFQNYFGDTGLTADVDTAMHGHIANCDACRAEFDSVRAVRTRVSAAVGTSAEFRIDPAFRAGLEKRLKAEFFSPEGDTVRARQRLRWLLVPAMAVFVLALGVGVVFFNYGGSRQVAGSFVSRTLAEFGQIVAGNHVYCTLEKLGMWETLSHTDFPDKAKYNDTIVAALKANYSDKIQLVSVHDCSYEGKNFRHVVLRNGAEVVSVFVDKANTALPDQNLSSPIVSDIENGFQVASFTNHERLVFVVSKLSETENVTIARTLSYSLGQI